MRNIGDFLVSGCVWFLRPLLRAWIGKPPSRGSPTIVPGLKDRVTVRWDSYAIPHVIAASEHDLFLSQGYLHAHERLWQMELNRRFFCGRLAEIFGNFSAPWRELLSHFRGQSIADLDYFMRVIGIRRNAIASLAILPQVHREQLQAYSDGVNRFIERSIKKLPLEFRLLRHEPDAWRPEDSLTIGKGFAFFLSTSLFSRLTMIAVARKVGADTAKFQSLFPFYPDGGPTVTRSHFDPSEGILRFVNGIFPQGDWSPAGQGSNNWVIAPSRAVAGNAILCNDPHLRLTLPSIWYLMHLKASNPGADLDYYNASGASIPGSPCIHLGTNRSIAWGVTAAVCDDAELYREKLQPGMPRRYLVGRNWREMEPLTENIRIRGKSEIKRTIWFTRHGPVINQPEQEPSGSEVLALRWTAHDPSQEFRALYGINRAHNWSEFLDSLSYQSAPTLNYVYADTHGNIGYTLAGKVPLRRSVPTLLPPEGWVDDHEWQGYVPFEELPRVYNPTEGILATANHRITDPSYPHYLSHFFEPPFRIRRIRSLLSRKPLFTTEDMAAMQTDRVSLHANDLLGILREDLESISKNHSALTNAAERLIHWNGLSSEDSVEAALFYVLHHRLMQRILLPALGEELFHAYVEIFNQCLAPLDRILGQPDSPWFADCPRRRMVENSLAEACEELTLAFGSDMSQWQWGKIHTLTLDHSFSRNKLLKSIFSVGPFPSAGSGTTLDLGYYRHSQPYRHVVGPSLRIIVELSDPPRLKCILPSGQSGMVFSPHYKDQTELWRRGAYIEWSADESHSTNGGLTTLEPRP